MHNAQIVRSWTVISVEVPKIVEETILCQEIWLTMMEFLFGLRARDVPQIYFMRHSEYATLLWDGLCSLSDPLTRRASLTAVKALAMIVKWLSGLTTAILKATAITQTFKNISQWGCNLVLQRASSSTMTVFTKVKHGSIIIACWNLHWRVHTLFNHMHTSVDIWRWNN